jgi:hypothetical protein
MSPNELAKMFWAAANPVTGFACVQAVAFSFLVLSKDVTGPLCQASPIIILNNGWIAFILSVIMFFLYGLATRLLGRRGESLVLKDAERPSLVDAQILASWKYMTRGRIFAIIVFFVVNFLALSGSMFGFSCH